MIWTAIAVVGLVVVGAFHVLFEIAAGQAPAATWYGRVIAAVIGLPVAALGGLGLWRVVRYEHGLRLGAAVFFALALLQAGLHGLFAAATGITLAATGFGIAFASAQLLVWVFLVLVALSRLALSVDKAPYVIAGLLAAIACVPIAFFFRGAFTEAGLAVSGDRLALVAVAVVLLVAALLVVFNIIDVRRVFGVARTVIDEAMRMKLAVVFVALLLLILPMLPLMLTEDQPLRYRIQQFLGWSMLATYVLLSLMTIFVACNTLSSEVANRQIFTVAVKPIGRGTYLLGKWVGITLFNCVLLAVVGLAIYGFTTFYLTGLPANDAHDRGAIREEVLTARVAQRPHPPQPFEVRARERLEEMMQDSPGDILSLGEEAAVQQGVLSPPRELQQQLGLERARAQVLERVRKQWWSIGPYERETYIFENLNRARDHGDFVQIRYKLNASKRPDDNMIRVTALVNGRLMPFVSPVDQFQVMPIPVQAIGEDGRLEITIANYNPSNPNAHLGSTISFPEKEGLEVLYQVDSFGPNFLRAFGVIAVKLMFLAMLGLATATFLSFPVACMLAFLIFGGAAMSEYFLDSLKYFGNPNSPDVYYLEIPVKWLGYSFVTALRQFGQYDVITNVVEGRLVSWLTVARCLGWIGLVWTGLTLMVGWLIFRVRELARVQV